jgi:hypothetical protein
VTSIRICCLGSCNGWMTVKPCLVCGFVWARGDLNSVLEVDKVGEIRRVVFVFLTMLSLSP